MTPSSDPVLRPCRGSAEWPALVRIWRSAVEATHHFLTPDDVEYFESRMASDYLPAVTVTVAEVDGVAVGFSGLAGDSLEMLFVEAGHRGRGVGSALLLHALSSRPELTLDVNEQNPEAVGFYRRHGFVTLGRSDTDSEGRPFPLLHLARRTA
ncbi:acetyltransferase [Rhodococcus sp. SGAir0479]|uniref:acetyltransferase n=1 Tax=Rhodococcus sp. SGAir0479 TaxID=2567884 RepID=UPI0010CCEF93|nr:acetyltransferase [Rhodococcus sp. SGAir0479]QCQ91662.1 acetyltransferase [Rhodococcus sp. SGAir0479]